MNINAKINCVKIIDDHNDYEVPSKSVQVFYSYIDTDKNLKKRQKAIIKLDKLVKYALYKKWM